ncbi:MAG TPA: 9-O-acetylesterase, partial [Phycisphaerae bacterium]|nr:9-O-acetylesterase [Phycisphaerae bacterium]
MKRTRFALVSCLFCCAAAPLAVADVRLPALLADDMVVQRDQPIVLWGWADPGEQVTANLDADRASATADAAGRWRIELPARPAGGPVEITIAGNNTHTLHNVLIGDVWLCSGQSNMEMKVANAGNADEEIRNADHPQIRLFSYPRVKAIARVCDAHGVPLP